MNDQQAAELKRRKRKRKQKRRLIAIAGFVLFTTGMAWFFESQATTTIIVTRYSDAQANGSLNASGERRAEELARLLGEVDVVAGVDAIFVAPQRASRDSSVPLAMHNQAPVHTIDNPADVRSLIAHILADYKGKIVVVITEPEYIQPAIREMHGSKKLPPMADDEYDNIYIVSIPWFGKVKTLRLRYGEPHQPSGTAQPLP
jgi:hypothetical protein